MVALRPKSSVRIFSRWSILCPFISDKLYCVRDRKAIFVAEYPDDSSPVLYLRPPADVERKDSAPREQRRFD